MSQDSEISTAESRTIHSNQLSTLLNFQITKTNPLSKNLFKISEKNIQIRKTKSKNTKALKSLKRPSKEPNPKETSKKILMKPFQTIKKMEKPNKGLPIIPSLQKKTIS